VIDLLLGRRVRHCVETIVLALYVRLGNDPSQSLYAYGQSCQPEGCRLHCPQRALWNTPLLELSALSKESNSCSLVLFMVAGCASMQPERLPLCKPIPALQPTLLPKLAPHVSVSDISEGLYTATRPAWHGRDEKTKKQALLPNIRRMHQAAQILFLDSSYCT